MQDEHFNEGLSKLCQAVDILCVVLYWLGLLKLYLPTLGHTIL